MAGFWDLLHRCKTNGWLALVLIAVNLVGIGYGYFYYWEVGQFDPASSYYVDWWWWPFTADSPNAVVLLTASLVLYRFGIRSKVLDSLAVVANVQIGLWTTYLFLAFPDQLNTWDWGGTNNLLFFSHMGMPLEALVLMPDLRRDLASRSVPLAGGIAAWFTLGLLLDYGSGHDGGFWPHVHPAPFVDGHGSLAVATPILTVIAFGVWWLLARRPLPDAEAPGPEA
ncbi:MAG: DUF1405 domain-containing protein [Thermoplasmatota archaeon]